jgi:hypothetical protein
MKEGQLLYTSALLVWAVVPNCNARIALYRSSFNGLYQICGLNISLYYKGIPVHVEVTSSAVQRLIFPHKRGTVIYYKDEVLLLMGGILTSTTQLIQP